MARCECPESWGWGGPQPVQYPYCPVHNPMRANTYGRTVQPRIYPDCAGKTEEVLFAPRIPAIRAVPPRAEPDRFPCGWDERDALV